MHDGEDRRIGADPERQCGDGKCGEADSLSQQASREADVLAPLAEALDGAESLRTIDSHVPPNLSSGKIDCKYACP